MDQLKNSMGFNWRDEKILITGGTGLIGTNLTARLRHMGLNVVSAGFSRGESRCDFRDAGSTKKIFDSVSPSVIFHLAAKVGGIYANVSRKADFYLDNTLINTNVMAEVQKRQIPYVFAMGTGCAYPKRLEGEMLRETDFLDGIPESTNDAYAYSKRNLLVHLKACSESFGLKYVYCIPANIYGPYDNFHPLYSHVAPGLIGRFIKAREEGVAQIKIWGDGTAKRDFLYIDDLIDAMIILCDNHTKNGPVNVATGSLTSIADLAMTINKVVGYEGEITHDLSFPVGQMQRLFNTDEMNSLGWSPQYGIEAGIEKTVRWCMDNPSKWRKDDN
ncbi:MAG: NAD-dependent epimerase/dehydratase family protein [Nitrospirae bacterium]|nr:NAD-dependent epimerase/dehydratase family protein [Nitrospirota bacterium]